MVSNIFVPGKHRKRDVATVFAYSHLNTPIDQWECAYCLKYFINFYILKQLLRSSQLYNCVNHATKQQALQHKKKLKTENNHWLIAFTRIQPQLLCQRSFTLYEYCLHYVSTVCLICLQCFFFLADICSGRSWNYWTLNRWSALVAYILYCNVPNINW